MKSRKEYSWEKRYYKDEAWPEELFHANKREKPTICKNMKGPIVFKSELKSGLDGKSSKKVAGQDSIVIEMLLVLDYLGSIIILV